MDLDDFGLPPLEEILGRVDGENSIDEPISRNSRFYDSTCTIKEEEDGRGRIQIENKEDYPSIVCRYYMSGDCSVTSGLCAHHYP